MNLFKLTAGLLALPDTLGDGEDVFAGVFTELQTSPDDDLVLGTLSYIISKLIRLNANFLQQDDAGSVQEIVYPKLGNLAAIGRMLLDREGAKNVQYGIVLAPRRNDLASMTPRIYKTAAEAWAASEALGGQNAIACVSTNPVVIYESETDKGAWS
ncbi:hypothetical protein GGTG_05569 [Gaeumannomyces tritici R3-111a-1]|uniref:Uncharacterized protein n=1 Tax=Gaeumannomyces tritici (strain R3-111a-1) TaxID=644352 RepID=J3NWA4_GAET3|nr:hypothetical protein GGTG_05569 [Gaeumannomyces tritici R3-111a-1]EJT75636.1 hypothetical protein GGTG_05569 [Gaeumannomyces tritici R3-111a-1]